MSATLNEERLTLAQWRIVSDTEEAAVQPLRQFCGASVAHLRPRQVAETCAGLLRDANTALRHERAECARLGGLLAQTEERAQDAHRDREQALAAHARCATERDDAQAALGLAELNLQRLRADSQRQRLALATIRDSAARAAVNPSDALSRFAQAVLPVADQGLGAVLGEAVHGAPVSDDADTESELRSYDALVKSIHEALGQDGDDSDALIVPAIKALREGLSAPDLAPLREALRAFGRCRCCFGRDKDGNTDVPHLEAVFDAAWAAVEGIRKSVATPESLGVRSQPGLARTLTAEAARVVEHAVAVLRPLVPGGEGLDPASLCAAVRELVLNADAELVDAGVMDQHPNGSSRTLDARVRLLAQRRKGEAEANRGPITQVERLTAERDALRAVMAARNKESQTTLRTVAGLREQVQRLTAERANIPADWQTVTKERDQARAAVRLVNAGPGDVWYWQGDGADYPESLSCPVVMSAATLRGLCTDRDALRDVRREWEALSEQVRQIRAVAFDPTTTDLFKARQIRRLLGHDGVEDPAVKPAPVTELPHPLTGPDPLTAGEDPAGHIAANLAVALHDAPPAQYAAEADALGVQS